MNLIWESPTKSHKFSFNKVVSTCLTSSLNAPVRINAYTVHVHIKIRRSTQKPGAMNIDLVGWDFLPNIVISIPNISNVIFVFFALDTFKNAWRKLTNSYTWVLGGVRVGLGGLGVQGSFVPGRFIKKNTRKQAFLNVSRAKKNIYKITIFGRKSQPTKSMFNHRRNPVLIDQRPVIGVQKGAGAPPGAGAFLDANFFNVYLSMSQKHTLTCTCTQEEGTLLD
jgi:hypothetical protein